MAAFVTGLVDGAGNLPFLRAVHRMGTSRDDHRVQHLPRYVHAAAAGRSSPCCCGSFPLPAVFVAGASYMVVMAGLSRYLPKRF